MRPFIWKKSYLTGIGPVDKDHKTLVNLTNDLYFAIHKGYQKNLIRNIYQEIMNFTDVHFLLEENLMKESRYPDYNKHKDEHQLLIIEEKKLLIGLELGGKPDTLKIYLVLRDVFISHIQNFDKDFGKYYTNSEAMLV